MNPEAEARPHPSPLPQEREVPSSPSLTTWNALDDTEREVRARLARVRHELELLNILEKVSGIVQPVERARLLGKLTRVKAELSVAVLAELAAIQRDY